MKLIKKLSLLAFIFVFNASLFAGIPVTQFRIEYSPSNPTVGQAVTFSLTIGDQNCIIESVIPDAANDLDSLLLFPASYIYNAPGEYHVAFDRVADFVSPECVPAIRDEKGKSRALEPNFEFGPVGGPFVPAVMQGQIFCSPITIAAAPAPIPTMGQWALIVLGLITTIVGVVNIFSKSRAALSKQILK